MGTLVQSVEQAVELLDKDGRRAESETPPSEQGHDSNLARMVEWLLTNGVRNPYKIVTAIPKLAALDIAALDATAEWLKNNNIENVGRLIEEFPFVLVYNAKPRNSYDTECMQGKFDLLKKMGLNAPEIIEADPQLLGITTKSLKTEIELRKKRGRKLYSGVKGIGLSGISRVTDAAPENEYVKGFDFRDYTSIEPRAEDIEERSRDKAATALRDKGSGDVEKAGQRDSEPMVLRQRHAYRVGAFEAHSRNEAMVELLNEIGIRDIEKAHRRYPRLMQLNPERAREAIAWLRALGVKNIRKAVASYPRLLGSTPEKMQTKANWLADHGARNVAFVIERHPRYWGAKQNQCRRGPTGCKDWG